ncbi:MAG: NAD-dependent epimerase/dehydratase family protein [Saprospiraceae bacterium]|nr:NAD-dependent epimerase/dehydratase family protein [Saprospiraceae bacterium]
MENQNRKIFITGGSGFISSHIHEVIDQNEIVNFDLKPPRENITSTFVQGDVRNLEDLNTALALHPCSMILALAAEHKDFGLSEEEYFKTNEFGTENICKAAEKAGITKIVFYSSVAVYGNNTLPSTEEMPPNPNLPYGASKWAGEKVLQKWVSENPERSVLIMRPTVVYGERNIANMFRLIQQINSGRYFHIGKGKNIKSIAYVKNLVEATFYLAERMKSGMEVFNYADKPQMTSREIGEVISNRLKKSPFTIPYRLALLMGIPFDILIKVTGKDYPISTNRIKKFCVQTYHKADKVTDSGFIPKYSNIEGLNNMIKWQKEQYRKEESYFNI